MKVKRAILEVGEDPPRGLEFWCPACDEAHLVRLGVGEKEWKWNGDFERPTIDGSVKCESTVLLPEAYAMMERHEAPPPGGQYPSKPTCCHSVVTDGQIRFCGDCTHALVNQTVPLPDWPERPVE